MDANSLESSKRAAAQVLLHEAIVCSEAKKNNMPRTGWRRVGVENGGDERRAGVDGKRRERVWPGETVA